MLIEIELDVWTWHGIGYKLRKIDCKWKLEFTSNKVDVSIVQNI